MAQTSMDNYEVGDKVRLVHVPSIFHERSDAVRAEGALIFEKCLGEVFSIRGFDEHGQLELWTTVSGNPERSLSRRLHWIWVEPECVEPVPTRKAKTEAR